MLEVLPREYEVPAPLARVWTMLRKETVERPGHRLLAESAGDHLLSWFEDSETWRGLDRKSGASSHDSLYGQMLLRLGDDATAVTTVWLKETERGCRLRVRRTYYSDKTRPYVASSRGHFTHDLVSRIHVALGLQSPAPPVPKS